MYCGQVLDIILFRVSNRRLEGMERAYSMQRAKLTRKRWQFIGILAVAVSVVAVLVILIVSLLGAPPVTKVKAYRLPCDYSENIKPFGQYVLFYDGVSIHCMSPTGSVRWSFQIGNDAGFSAGEEYIAAWTGSTIYVIDQNGNSTYNDNLGETIQFARIGKQYVAAVVGSDTTPDPFGKGSLRRAYGYGKRRLPVPDAAGRGLLRQKRRIYVDARAGYLRHGLQYRAEHL